MTDRAAADKLREELGITEEHPLSRVLATAGEMRALRAALRLTTAQLAARLGVSQSTVEAWAAGGRPVRPRGATATRLARILDRARELGLLAREMPKRGTRRSGGSQPLVCYACAGCGETLLRKAVTRTRSHDSGRVLIELCHTRNGKRCGPVVAADRRQEMPPERSQMPQDRRAIPY